MSPQQKKRIGDLLMEAGLLTEEQLNMALQQQKELQMRLGDVLISQNYITEQQLIEVLEFQLGIAHVQLYRQKIDPKVIHLIPQKLAKQHQVLPIHTNGNKLILAMADPLDYFAIDEVRMMTGLQVEPVIASKDELSRAIQRYYGLQESVDQIMQDLDVSEQQSGRVGLQSGLPLEMEDDSPVVRTVNQLIRQAVKVGASDIHLDPQPDGLQVRYRVDGVMRTERSLPANMAGVLAARIKVMGQLNVTERRLPQDGRVEIEIDFRKIDIRISTLPTIHGEKIVLRILDLANRLAAVDALDFSERNLQRFRQGIHTPNGTVLITGPTGSGKTTTLYAGISELNQEAVNVITIEDPVEIQLSGINQIQVNPKTGLTFAAGLRSILRQDPDIIMVGEIRDRETAEIAVRAALTGHLVLSTLHTNSAVNAITRLIDMGIEPYLISSALTCVVAQRLVRRVCDRCGEPYEPLEAEKQHLEKLELPTTHVRKGSGCADCAQTGYKGRLGIHEVVLIDDTFREMILQRSPDQAYLTHARKQGMTSMLEDGMAKVAAGRTTVEEVYRVTQQSGDWSE